MRLFAFFLSLAFLLPLCGCKEGDRVAVVEVSRLFQESEPGKAGMEHLKAIEETMQTQLEAAREMLRKAPNNEALRERFQKTFLGYQKIVESEQQKVVDRLNDLMQHTLDHYRTQHGYTLILNADNMLSHDMAVDVTDAVIREMNESPLVFEAVKLEGLSAGKGSRSPSQAPAQPDQN